ncbi:MAG: peptidoglycan-binding protein [Betaproteobacteria bacterium]|nr:peptidoglycan-binding protein [Betaproteobacteria bacterium]
MFDNKAFCKYLLPVAAAAAFSGCSNMEMGSQSAKTTVTGAASGSTTEGAGQIERCPKPLGTLAVVEDTNTDWYRTLSTDYRLGPTTPVLRLLVQESNCFVVVERGRAMNNMMQERALQDSGELRKKSNFGKGQMVAADYTMSPSITFSNQNAGGLGAALGGRIGGGTFGALAASANVKEASTVLTLIENRSGVQISAAEGSASNVDFGAVGSIIGRHGGGGLGGYKNTAEGKVIVAAFTDAYNNLVRATRNYQMQTVKGGLGTGGELKVQGAEEAKPSSKKSSKKAQ